LGTVRVLKARGESLVLACCSTSHANARTKLLQRSQWTKACAKPANENKSFHDCSLMRREASDQGSSKHKNLVFSLSRYTKLTNNLQLPSRLINGQTQEGQVHDARWTLHRND
jgi:invasion protein IalB